MSDLPYDVRCRAESVEPKPNRVANHSQGSIADQPGAKQRRATCVVKAIRQRKTETRVGNSPFCITAVYRVAGKARSIAEILLSRSTIETLAAGPAQPGNPDPLTDFQSLNTFSRRRDASDNLVSGNKRTFWLRKFSIDDMQVRPASRAGADFHQNLPVARHGYGNIA